jgi:hypothetical protein
MDDFARDAAVARLRLFPRLISPRSASISFSLLPHNIDKLFPSPPIIWLACAPLPLGRRRPVVPVPLAPGPPEPAAPPVGIVVDVNGRGNGEGSSSTESECGFRKGPVVIGRLLMSPAPFVNASPLAPSGVGGGDVPSLFRSFRVM